MSAGKPIDLVQAASIAGELHALLAPACERIAIAGSIRRQKPQVRDIELVAIPAIQPTDAGTLWSDTVDVDHLEVRVKQLLGDGRLVLRDVENHRRDGSVDVGHKNGPRFKALVYQHMPVDLFVVRPPAEWGVQFALRTGPGDWNTKLVTECKRRMVRVDDHGQVWAWGKPIPCPEEEDFFRALGQPWVEPADRHPGRVRIQIRQAVPA